MATLNPNSKRGLEKQERRAAVFRAAERLIRERGNVSFSMQELADTAGLSLATPYNIVGTKSAILYGLLNQSADQMFKKAETLTSLSSIESALNAADALAKILREDPNYYRPLYAFLMGVPDPGWRPAFISRSHQYWTAPFRRSTDTATAFFEVDVIGDLLVLQALGCVEMWVHQEISDDALEVELRRACSAVLLNLAKGSARDLLLEYFTAPRTIRFERASEGAN